MSSRWLAWAAIGLAAAGLACRTRKQRSAPTPVAALAQLQAAIKADNLTAVWELVDKKTQWSLMSVHKDQRETCELVRASYPKQRQARELRRCHAAEVAPDAKAFFVALAREQRGEILEPLARFKGPGKASQEGARVQMSDGRRQLAFCEEERAWTYCGLREYAEQLKVKAARDRATVRENIEAFK